MAALLLILLLQTAAQAATPMIVAGANSNFSCMLTSAGGVKCWGINNYGQLGDGSSTQRVTPVDVSGLTSGVSAITAGKHHVCALTDTGGVKCWGRNSSGQLGDGTISQQLIPVDVSGLSSGVSAITAGDSHTCAMTSGGAVKCWGLNTYGQLGDGSSTQRVTPVDVSGLTSGVTALTAGLQHTCVLTSGGGAKCWGNNSFGQLGDGSRTKRLTAVDVSSLTSGVSAVVAGNRKTCALTSGGAVKCWGDNENGQLGDGSTANRLSAVDVIGLSSGVSTIGAGAYHVCALTNGGAVKCWGGNYDGQLGDGSLTNRLTAVDVNGLSSGVSAITAGFGHTCVLTIGGAAKCWGGNGYGQLGDGSDNGKRLIAVDVNGLSSGVSKMAVGASHSCALTVNGTVKCWGYSGYGQLGDGTSTGGLAPVDVVGLGANVSTIAAGDRYTCALGSAGGVKCWGENSYGQLGDGSTTNQPSPVDVMGLSSGVSAIAAGYDSTCAITTGGAVKCWGGNSSGQLGDGTGMDQPMPVDVVGLSTGVIAIEVSDTHSCALTSAGGVKCWGDNMNGQLGDGTTTSQPTPVDVVGLTSGVIAITGAYGTSCALTAGGGVKCWGDNSGGRLGDGSTTQRLTPVDVSGLTSGVSAIAASNAGVCALTSGGGVKCWGENSNGRLGDGSTTNRLTPVDAIGLGSGVSAIAAGGGAHNCALTIGGGVKCWGDNSFGQLGDGTAGYRPLASLFVVGFGPASTLTLAPGWNLLGNSLAQPLSVATAFSDPAVVTTVWKWDAVSPGWQFYAPSMDANALQTYVAAKGYSALSVINPGEGYWVNAKAPATINAQTAAAFSLTVANLSTGWNLVATGNDVTPSAFNLSLSATPPVPGVVPLNLTTLWAWDNVASNWLFYAPSLEANGGLASYITSKSYLDFTQSNKKLGNGVGFWVNKP